MHVFSMDVCRPCSWLCDPTLIRHFQHLPNTNLTNRLLFWHTSDWLNIYPALTRFATGNSVRWWTKLYTQFLHQTFSPHQITTDTSDTDLIVDKHKSDLSDCDTIVFQGWPESINFVSDEVNDESKSCVEQGYKFLYFSECQHALKQL